MRPAEGPAHPSPPVTSQRARPTISRFAPPITAIGAALLLAAAFPAGCGADPLPLPPPQPSASAAPPPPEPAPTVAPAPPPKPHRFAVAAESATAAKIAMDVLERGGNAVDAAVTGVLVGGVTHPVSSGIGGGGFAVIWDAKAKQIKVLDFRETAPIGIRPNDYLKREPLPDGKRGVLFGVPGEIAGLSEMAARWGRRSFADDVLAAAEVADRGFPLSAHMARALKWNEAWVRRSPRYAFFAPGGALAGVKETVQNPALAATLRRVAAEGKAAFYEGRIADDILETAQRGGSRITAKELREFKVVERAPLHAAWEGYDVFTMPPESAGGLMILEALRMHKKADLAALGYGSGAYLHLLAETLRGAVADRVRAIGDPDFVRADADELASVARMRARRAKISLTTTTPAPGFPLEESGTSHLVAVDDQGDVVSITSTVNDMFGCRLVTKGGFVLNDEARGLHHPGRGAGLRHQARPGPQRAPWRRAPGLQHDADDCAARRRARARARRLRRPAHPHRHDAGAPRGARLRSPGRARRRRPSHRHPAYRRPERRHRGPAGDHHRPRPAGRGGRRDQAELQRGAGGKDRGEGRGEVPRRGRGSPQGGGGAGGVGEALARYCGIAAITILVLSSASRSEAKA